MQRTSGGCLACASMLLLSQIEGETAVSRKSLQLVMCAAVAAALGMFGTAAQATFYTGTFDPPVPEGHFVGDFELFVHDGCNTYHCDIDLLSLSITTGDMLGGHDMFTAGPISNIAPFGASFVGGLNFTSEPIFLNAVSASPLLHGIHVNAVCGPELMFNAGTGGDFGATISYDCIGSSPTTDTATYTAVAVPEPGTLALILGGVGAGWLTRRRKSAA
jgi:PEP-CTERM motif